MKLNKQNKKGFTIVELVIVIAVIGILSAILIPTFANLTNDAQKAARKQQAADAYTAYLLEATDNQYDGLYTRSGVSPDYVYTPASIAIAQKSQAQVVVEVNDKSWFTYDAEKGWQESETAPAGKDALVCEAFKAADKSAGKTFYDAEHNAKFTLQASASDDQLTAANEKVSTFNGAIIYTRTAA